MVHDDDTDAPMKTNLYESEGGLTFLFLFAYKRGGNGHFHARNYEDKSYVEGPFAFGVFVQITIFDIFLHKKMNESFKHRHVTEKFFFSSLLVKI